MIWYEDNLRNIKNCPQEVSVVLQGILNPVSPTIPLIIIQLVIYTDTTTIARVLYTHNPTMRYEENPSSDDVLAKYSPKIAKWKEKLAKMDYQDILAIGS